MDQTIMPQIGLPLIIAGIAIGSIINALVLMWAAGYMDIPDADFGKCFITAIVVTVVNTIVSIPLRGHMNPGGFALSFLISAVINTIFIKVILNTEWGRAFLTFIVMLVIYFIIAFVTGLCCAGGACFMMPGRF